MSKLIFIFWIFMEKHTFLKPLKVAFFLNFFIYFYFLSLVRTLMNNYAKYQHPKQKFSIFLKNHKIAFFYIFRGSKKMGPLKKKKFKFFFYVLDPRWTVIPNLLHFGWNFKHKPPQATDSPHPLLCCTELEIYVYLTFILLQTIL